MWLKIKKFLWEVFESSSFSILMVHTNKELCDKCVPDSEEGNHCLECGRDCTEDLYAEAEYKMDWR